MSKKLLLNFWNFFWNNSSEKDYQKFLNEKYGNTYDNVVNIDDDLINKRSKKRKKSKILLGLIATSSIICLSSVVYVVIYYVNNDSNKEKDKYVSSKFQTDTSNASVQAMKYMLHKSLSINFTIHNNLKNWSLSLKGTGWIIDKNSNTGDYYIATNIHVGTILTEIGQDIDLEVDSNGSVNLKDASITKTDIGFIKNSLIDNSPSDSLYHYAPYQISHVTLSQTPSVFYMANTKSDDSLANIFNNPDNTQINDDVLSEKNLNEESYSGYQSSGGLDFMILKMNFNNPTGNTHEFKSWLDQYTTTQFCSEDEITNNVINKEGNYYMGGFPAIGDKGSASWVGYSNMTGIATTSTKTTESNNLSNNIVGSNSGLNYYYISVDEEKVISYDQTQDIKYCNYNVGNYISFNAKSEGGSSGSMIVINTGTNDNPEFKIVGIYWGYVSETTNSNKYNGKASLLFSPSYSYEVSGLIVPFDKTLSVDGYNVISNFQTKISEDISSSNKQK